MPPCQAFSVFGKRKGLEDSRGKMVFEFVRIIAETQPDVFLMENVFMKCPKMKGLWDSNINIFQPKDDKESNKEELLTLKPKSLQP